MAELADRFLFSVEGVSQTLRVVRFSGMEGISELFHLELTFASSEGSLEIDDFLGKPAVVTMTSDGEPRYVHGIVSRFEEGAAAKKLTLYHATIVPTVWRLQHRHDIRIFQELTAPQIIKKVLEGAGLAAGDDFRLSLQGSYRTHEYCVQYRESDWAFVSRLLEEEGIFWFFEHHEDKHILVMGDKPSVHSPIPGEATVVFRPPLGALSSREHISRFHFIGEVRPGRVTLRDFNFQKPTLLLEGEAQATQNDDLEIYDYPGVYAAPGEGAALAKLRLEERQAMRRVGDGESACERLVAGHTFTLAEHSREPLNRGYLITRVEYEGYEPLMSEVGDVGNVGGGGGGEQRFTNRFQVIPSDVIFRPPLCTPKPVVRGVQTAIVVGPAGEEIYTDEFGRVKVQFHWDRLGKKNEHSSCWMRVSQLWAGGAWGGMAIPRINQEVLVDFLEGDPDRPIIIGRVYHGTNVPPYALPANKTKTTIKSNSSPGGEGSNELRFEDEKGSEEVYLHAQKDLVMTTENDKTQLVGHDEELHVVHDRSITVDVDQREEIGHDRARSVGHDETASIGNDRSISVGKNHTEQIGGDMSLSIAKSRTEDVGTDATESIGGKLALTVGNRYDADVSADMALTVGGSATSEIKLEKLLKVGSKVVIECGDSTITVEKNGKITIAGKNLSLEAESAVKISGQKITVESSGEVKIEASGKVEVKGSGPMNIDASGPMKLKGANVGIN